MLYWYLLFYNEIYVKDAVDCAGENLSNIEIKMWFFYYIYSSLFIDAVAIGYHYVTNTYIKRMQYYYSSRLIVIIIDCINS